MKSFFDTAAHCTALLMALTLFPAASEAAKKLTWTHQIRTKMYIGPIPILECDPVGVLGIPLTPNGVARAAAFLAFCKATDLAFGENPLTGSTAAPLDARVTTVVNFRFRCEAGKVIPVEIGTMTPIATIGGPEPLGLTGIANPVTTRNTILANGLWGFVSSGRPAALAEPAFAAFALPFGRARKNIWNRSYGSVTCAVDAGGFPTATHSFRLQVTRFPSHRSYRYTVLNTFIRIAHFRKQDAFSNLWKLPAVGAP